MLKTLLQLNRRRQTSPHLVAQNQRLEIRLRLHLQIHHKRLR